MRNLLIGALGAAGVACAKEAARVDTAIGRDSAIVAGPPAVPSSQTPIADPTPTGTKSTPPAPAPERARTDSVRGMVSVVGTSFDKRVMIAERATQRRVEVIGSLAALIGHVAGTEVSAVGSLAGTQLNASRFIVRSVDGQPAIDGTLRTEGGVLFIVTTEGTRTRIATPPPPLVGHDGARVWVTGDPAKGISSFGFIDPPR